MKSLAELEKIRKNALKKVDLRTKQFDKKVVVRNGNLRDCRRCPSGTYRFFGRSSQTEIDGCFGWTDRVYRGVQAGTFGGSLYAGAGKSNVCEGYA